jgi:hypothetical protein
VWGIANRRRSLDSHSACGRNCRIRWTVRSGACTPCIVRLGPNPHRRSPKKRSLIATLFASVTLLVVPVADAASTGASGSGKSRAKRSNDELTVIKGAPAAKAKRSDTNSQKNARR